MEHRSSARADDARGPGTRRHGLYEDTACAQYFRDGRIITIYEGTTGIHANDLVDRKIVRDRGEGMRALLARIEAVVEALATAGADYAELRAALSEGRKSLGSATD